MQTNLAHWSMGGGDSYHRQDPLPNRVGQLRPRLDDDHEGDVDLRMVPRAGLGTPFGAQLARCGECAVLCAARLRIGGFSRELRPLFDSPWGGPPL